MQLSTGLQVRIGPAERARMSARETSSLEAYRALTEGRLKLEALEPGRDSRCDRRFRARARARSRSTRWPTSAWRTRGSGSFRPRARGMRRRPITSEQPSRMPGARSRSIPSSPRPTPRSASCWRAWTAVGRSGGRRPARRGARAGQLAASLPARHGRVGRGTARMPAGRRSRSTRRCRTPISGLAMVRIARRDLQAADRLLQTGVASHGRAGAG